MQRNGSINSKMTPPSRTGSPTGFGRTSRMSYAMRPHCAYLRVGLVFPEPMISTSCIVKYGRYMYKTVLPQSPFMPCSQMYSMGTVLCTTCTYILCSNRPSPLSFAASLFGVQPCRHRCVTTCHLLQDISLLFFFLFPFVFHLCSLNLHRPSLSGSPFASLDARTIWTKLRLLAQKTLLKLSTIMRMLLEKNQTSHQTDEAPSQLPSVRGEMSLPN